MAKISDALVSAFVSAMAPKDKKPSESYVFGIARNTGDRKTQVKIDGSDVWYEMPSAVKVNDNDRVAIMIKNRKGTVTSNITNPSINTAASLSVGTIQTAGEPTNNTGDSLRGTKGGTDVTTASITSPVVVESESKELLIAELFTDDAYDVINMGVDIKGHKTQLNVPMIRTTNFLNTSDRRLKMDIFDTEESNALGKINQIQHRKYVWKEGNIPVDIGYIAQEMGEIDPNLMNEDGGLCSVNMSYLIPLMSKAIQELSAEVDELRKEVKRLGETKHNSVSAEE